ncbi:MAG: hypothetical protein SFU55_02125 [Methylophilus sp.]|nr:hypothetical protein [Methylophilus sp.]
MKHFIFCMFFLAFSSTASALDISDVGTYAVIRGDGYVTDYTFFISFINEKWSMEKKAADGTWSNVTCETDCIFRESNQNDIARFFPAETLATINTSCVHNTAFAFCSYTFKTEPEKKGHIFIALITKLPTPVALKKISEIRNAP